MQNKLLSSLKNSNDTSKPMGQGTTKLFNYIFCFLLVNILLKIKCNAFLTNEFTGGKMELKYIGVYCKI